MTRVRWWHHVLCALFGHQWRMFEGLHRGRPCDPIISEANTCRRCLVPITATDEGLEL